jgi:hypothetical protein
MKHVAIQKCETSDTGRGLQHAQAIADHDLRGSHISDVMGLQHILSITVGSTVFSGSKV